MFAQPWLILLAAVAVTTLSAGRLTRLITADSYPPVLWIKERWDNWTAKSETRGKWWLILNCHWCLGPWMTLLVGGWAVIDGLLDGIIDWPWWAFNGWLAVSYLVSILVHHDEGKDEGS